MIAQSDFFRKCCTDCALYIMDGWKLVDSPCDPFAAVSAKTGRTLHGDREGIIAGTIADNLRFAKENATLPELKAALWKHPLERSVRAAKRDGHCLA